MHCCLTRSAPRRRVARLSALVEMLCAGSKVAMPGVEAARCERSRVAGVRAVA